MKSISIVHPSRGRVVMSNETISKWIISASKTIPIEYILSVDETDPELINYIKGFEALKILLENNNVSLSIVINPNITAIEAINVAAKQTVNDLIIVVSDDFDCFPNWDLFLQERLNNKSDYIVKTSDGLQPILITLPIMDRVYYNRFGYVYYNEYKHMFCDTEMTDVGHLLGKVVDLQSNDFIFRHNHYSTGGMIKDIINEKNDLTWIQGEELYYSRKSNQFYLKF